MSQISGLGPRESAARVIAEGDQADDATRLQLLEELYETLELELAASDVPLETPHSG